MKDLKVIAFDADDTLWVNEPYFQDTERRFCALLEDYLPQHSVSRELYQTQIKNMSLYGYGAKALMLNMVETALNIAGERVDPAVIGEIIRCGQKLLDYDIELLDGVTEVLESLKGRYRLVVATKGDLLDQERKLGKSGIAHYFHHIEIMSEKGEKDYLKMLRHLDCRPEEFLMIGNSLKSDVLPVLAIGGHAIHVPYHVTWVHEQVDHVVEHERFFSIAALAGVLDHFAA